jgi:hypothetical protein
MRMLSIAALAAIIALTTLVFSDVALSALLGERGTVELTYDAFMRQW